MVRGTVPMEAKVVVLGAGVNGVGSALAVQRAVPRASVTIVTADVTPNTTGDGAAGIWGPHYVNGDPLKVSGAGADPDGSLGRDRGGSRREIGEGQRQIQTGVWEGAEVDPDERFGEGQSQW